MVHEADADTTTSIDSNGAVLIIGASGSIGRHAVAQALEAGHETRALVRRADQDSLFPEGTRVVVGDPPDPDVLAHALDRVSAIVFTQGTYSDADAEQANYRPVKAMLEALKAPARIAMMTALGVTKPTTGHDWKRRAERLVRASGHPYTIVRPGWFDYNEPDEQHLVMRQGDTHWAGNASDGVVSRAQIAQALIASLNSDAADRKTFELVAEKGEAQADLDPLFAGLQPDVELDGPLDRDNLPLDAEPQDFLADLDTVRGRF
ncbi:SDR family oxidoreductase [Rothia uropygialis]|uniref:SDR family oxidoreductase n=1 Tax=Kocuria sp. 36 TaxID=1415402 RepID=UPI00101DAB54|nr:SDR family oxidoreductase [Kocuria sp. 36]